jgi:HAD superfamily hydrolase (TIGR01509 family)
MPPWSSIDTIMFDMDGTLLDLHFDDYFWRELVPKIYSEHHSVSEEHARELIISKYSEVYGTLDWYCLDYWEAQLELDITGLKSTIKHKIALRPNVEKLLRELQLSEKRVLLITNAHPASLELKMQHTGIGDFFHQRISSHSLSLAKENHGFWERLQQLETYDPERTLLFDDSLPVLRQAGREGIRHLYGIERPDSQRPPVSTAEFPLIADFDHIMPAKPAKE